MLSSPHLPSVVLGHACFLHHQELYLFRLVLFTLYQYYIPYLFSSHSSICMFQALQSSPNSLPSPSKNYCLHLRISIFTAIFMPKPHCNINPGSHRLEPLLSSHLNISTLLIISFTGKNFSVPSLQVRMLSVS